MASKVTFLSTHAGIVLLLLSVVGSPPLAWAQGPSTGGVNAGERPAAAGAFCENLESARENVLSRLAERERAEERRATWEEQREERRGQLENGRDERAERRAVQYDRLVTLATTDEQRAAVATFEDTVEALVATRVAAVDEAIETYEATMAALLEDRSEAVAAYKTEIEATINAIFDDAEAACADGATALEVRSQVRDGMQAMREEISASKDDFTLRAERQAARETRQAAVAAATEAFQAEYQAAKADLRTALTNSPS